MRAWTILASLVALAPSTVFAAPRLHAHDGLDVPLGDLVAAEGTVTGRDGTQLVLARQVVAPSETVTTAPVAAVAASRIIYLNHTGATLSPGLNDARTNKSTLVPSTVAIPAWNASPQLWADTVTCMQDMFARWDVTVTDQDPGNVDHVEAIFGGSPTLLGMPSNVGGVSPFTLDCTTIEDSIVFAFTDNLPQNAQVACEVMAQEVAHSFGLDHEYLAADPMTYLQYNGNKTFQDQDVACGEYGARSCGIGGNVCSATQNSVAMLTDRLGLRSGATPQPPEPGATDPSEDDGVTDPSDATDPADPSADAASTGDTIVGGCSSTGRGSSAALLPIGLALAALVRRRRRV